MTVCSSPFLRPSSCAPKDSSADLKPVEIQQIVFHYFLHEGMRRPEHYLPEIVKEATGRPPTPSEIHYAKQLYHWIKRNYYLLEEYVLNILYEQQLHISELDPLNVLLCFEKDTKLSLRPQSFWIQCIYIILETVSSQTQMQFVSK